MTAPTKLKEPEEIYIWIDMLINGCDKPVQLDGCEVLINYFENRKFKNDVPSEKEMRDYTVILRKFLKRKRGALRKRLFIERKNNGNNGKV